ncbi:hypothetical protein [Sphingomonas sp. SUN039]|uniref:GumC family protein n=1 Tax=Sphingomonas sp. SUN039 TaxID=2937787 RepID=UPI002164632C|nr:hypothetical protein [Sphingomonas sp. SUN039]UVO52754.1 hypothetical protein M0209_00910 [Sphingomonas sp. SUN039]
MKHEPLSPPAPPAPDTTRRLVRGWRLVRDGLPSFGRYRRYALTLGPSLAVIWALAALYVVATPPRYTSRMTFILPGTGVGGSINVETIGQATTTTASPFSGSTLSPTESYKRLLAADVTLRAAARLAGDDPFAFPKPVVTLTDQTNLIEVTLSGHTAAKAHARAEALRRAFLAGLDALRQDEAATREANDRRQIAALQGKARDAQQRVLAFQGRTGLVSLDQFNSRISALDTLRDRERVARTTQRAQAATTSQLSGALQIGPAEARRAMILKADPLFRSLLDRYAEVATTATDKGSVLGPQHATVEELDARKSGVRDALIARGRALTGLDGRTLMTFADLSVSDGRERLFEALVSRLGDSAGARAATAEIRAQIGQQNAETTALAGTAAQLADLVREQRVAEAVFSSALARLDTNKADPFASYPLVQTLEAPSLPIKPSSPSLLLALAGAIGASVLLIVGFLLLWLRQPIIQRLLPNA